MEDIVFIELTNRALIATAVLAIPILIPGLITGILISLFQAVTQISEQTLTFVPKLVVLIVSYLVMGPWIVRFMTNYSTELISRIPEFSAS